MTGGTAFGQSFCWCDEPFERYVCSAAVDWNPERIDCGTSGYQNETYCFWERADDLERELDALVKETMTLAETAPRFFLGLSCLWN